MKKTLITTTLISGAALSLAACENFTFEDDEFAVPYTMERTARHSQNAAPAPEPAPEPTPERVVKKEKEVFIEQPVEKVFKRQQSK